MKSVCFHLLVCAAMLLSLGMAGMAQNQDPAAAAPAHLGTSPLLFAGETPRSNMLSVGFSGNSSYNDNPLNTVPAQSALFTGFSSHVAFDMDRPLWSASLRYDPQYTYSPDLSTYNSVGHVAGGTFSYRLGSRWTVSLRESYSQTTNPTQMAASEQATPVFGLPNQLNQTGYGSYLSITTEQSGAEINYALSAHSSLGFGGGYNSVQSSQPGVPSFYSQDMTSWSGYGFYSRQVSRHQTLGMQFQWQRIETLGGANQATPISLQYFHRIQLARGFTVSLFGGPELTDTTSILPPGFLPSGSTILAPSAVLPVKGRQWSGAGGGTLGWNTRRNAASASFMRQTSSGGAVGTISNSSTVTGSYRRQLTRQTAVNFMTSYTTNSSVPGLAQVPVGNYLTALAQCTRTVGPMEISFSYTRYQIGGAVSALPELLAGDSNQVMVSISYFFRKALSK